MKDSTITERVKRDLPEPSFFMKFGKAPLIIAGVILVVAVVLAVVG
jgi:hypothetical protein